MNNIFRNENTGKLILRLVVGILILFHGVAKISHPGSLGFVKDQLLDFGLPTFIAYGVYIGEIIAPIMIILGFYTRLGASIIVINMLFAIILFHLDDLFRLGEHGGWALELQAFYLFCGLTVLLLGSGRFAIRPGLNN